MLKQILKTEITSILKPYILSKGLNEPPSFTLESPPKNIKADFAVNIALILAKTLKSNPRMIAGEISDILRNANNPAFSEVTIAGAGFVNITLSHSFLVNALNLIISNPNNFAGGKTEAGKKVLIEFVSANPTGPLHIGHGRGAAIGSSLSNIFEYMGYDVEREYYINDVGNQMEILGKSLKARFEELSHKGTSFPDDGYKGDYIIDIAKKLGENKKELSEYSDFAKEHILNSIKDDLKIFGIEFNNYFSESKIARDKDVQGKTEVEKVCEGLLKDGFAEEKEGALWFLSTKYGDDKDRVLKRSDGRFTYLASDIAYHKNKLSRNFDILIDIWGADHHGYIKRVEAAVEALGAKKEVLTVILYQLVSLSRDSKPIAMSTRAGEFVTLREVLDEVGCDATRFSFMLRAPDSQLDFDLELAKKQSSENPVFYVQYVHARSCSIFKQASMNDNEITPVDAKNKSILSSSEERELIIKLILFPDTLTVCLNSLSPHHLTAYLMETADLYHRFYENCKVLVEDKSIKNARLSLIKAVKIVIKCGLGLLGVSAPEKM